MTLQDVVPADAASVDSNCSGHQPLSPWPPTFLPCSGPLSSGDAVLPRSALSGDRSALLPVNPFSSYLQQRAGHLIWASLCTPGAVALSLEGCAISEMHSAPSSRYKDLQLQRPSSGAAHLGQASYPLRASVSLPRKCRSKEWPPDRLLCSLKGTVCKEFGMLSPGWLSG